MKHSSRILKPGMPAKRAFGVSHGKSPDELGPPYARPAMRGRYLIRHPLKARVIGAVDSVLGLIPAKQVGIPERPARILVCNWAHLGDVILTLPALRWLREQYPEARIDMLLGSWSKSVVQGLGLVDNVIVIDHWRHNRAPLSKLDKFKAYAASAAKAHALLRANRYEVALDFYQHFPNAGLALYGAGLPVRIGYSSGGFGPLQTHSVDWSDDGRHVIAHHQDLLARLPAARGKSIALDAFYPMPARAEGAGPQITALPREYVLVHTGAGAVFKEWPEDHWAQVVAFLAAQGLGVVLAGAGPREATRSQRLAAAVPRTIDLCDKLSWSDFVAAVAGAKLLVCLDSMAAHLGAAFKVPTVSIRTGTVDPRQWGPFNPRAVLLSGNVTCAPCYRRGCNTMDCVRGVSVADVCGAIERCLETAGVHWEMS